MYFKYCLSRNKIQVQSNNIGNIGKKTKDGDVLNELNPVSLPIKQSKKLTPGLA